MLTKIWTEAEVEQLKRFEIPENKTRRQAQLKAYELGFKLPILRNNLWSAEEIELLKQHKIPPGRTKRACEHQAWRQKILFHPSGWSMKDQSLIAQKNKDKILEEVKKTGQIRATARKFGVSYATVSYLSLINI